jgi:uncharacterized protein YbdZ (MbtH family)
MIRGRLYLHMAQGHSVLWPAAVAFPATWTESFNGLVQHVH